jgi:hypothetical protein
MRNLRTVASAAASTVGVLLIITGLLLAYTSQALFNSNSFADRAAASLENPDVAQFAADRITDALVSQHRDLTPYRPLILGAARAIVSSDAFRGIVRRAARTAHSAITSAQTADVLLTLSDIGIILRSALAAQPEIASKLPESASALIGSLEDLPAGELTIAIVRIAHRLRDWMLILFLAGFGLMFLGLLLSVHRKKALLRQGLALILISMGLYILVRFGGNTVAAAVDEPMASRAIVGLWDAFWADFLYWVFALSGIGVIVVAGVTSLQRSFHPLSLARDGYDRLAAGPASTALRIFRGGALICIGLLLIFWPLEVLTALGFLIGVCLGFAGLREVFEILLKRATPAGAGAEPPAARPHSALGEAAAVGVVAVLLVVAGIAFLGRSAGTAAAPKTIDACNGHRELCRRPLDEVVFAGTHNSMGAADIPDWMFANQERDIMQQLEDGIRALLIDAHLAVPIGDKVKTSLEDESAARASYEDVIGKEGVDAAMRIRDRLVGGAEGKPEVYLCHGFCELGAIHMISLLKSIRAFLVVHPNEVLIIIVQDEGVPPEDIKRCFEESGLIDFVYHGPVTPPWPTLQEMVGRDERVLVMAEHESEGVPWLHAAFEVLQETPYRFRNPSEFSCRPNRGGTSGSLLLLNHWIETPPNPLPSNAEIVNAYDFLLARARQCERERGRIPNIIAVDFYRTGDLFAVVGALNGVPSK